MITLIRTADINDGMAQDAFAWAVQVSHYINDNVDGVEVTVMRNIGGPVYQVHWVSRYDSLAEYARLWAALEADPGYQELIEDARDVGFFVGMSIEDHIYEAVG